MKGAQIKWTIGVNRRMEPILATFDRILAHHGKSRSEVICELAAKYANANRHLVDNPINPGERPGRSNHDDRND